MKSRFAGRSLISLVFSLAALSANADVILNFDELPGTNYLAGTFVDPQFRLSTHYLNQYGVQFSSGGGYVSVVNEEGRANSQPNGITGSTPGNLVTYSRSNPIVATFWDPSNPSTLGVTNYVALQGDRDSAGWSITLNAYDINGNLVDSDTQIDDGGASLIVVSDTYNIHRIEFLGSPDDVNGVAVDNFRFDGVHPVPEPATISVFGLGLAWVLRRRRRTGLG